ncbi:Gfo/Idh/MocA family oxidoreductase [Helicobacter apodemus]|uniref:Gfo/Idh/MocA family oxidoreductase n=1 Tax=Helicobacter apodemus TaxID=135569 RepID=A0A4U8UBR4_9HELI|nr:Gfo/Idh/MocA family oxidoreductase [Helicobacter apodemus]MDE6958229.1 Gfo/Idh/MocA family oxidoreductase [Helicobacter apodemus]TLE14160.1 Gfo/Idh/MocA family oxidoreductase [Helicobacter apodemus]
MLGVALLGCGRIASRHAELLSKGEIVGASLVCVCDSDAKRARAFGEKYQVPFFENLALMMEQHSSEIDIVSILTPSGMHAKNTLEVAKYKKHIIVEKPIALTLEDADKMIEACDRNNIRLFVVKQNRFNLPVQKLKEALDKGRFGKLVMGSVRVRWCRDDAYYKQDSWRGTWAMDGGVFTNQASHHIDLLEWMMGDVESVFAKARTALSDIETEDTGVAVLRFKSGALGIIEATTATRPFDLEGSISILGELGSVEIGGFAVNEIKHWNFTQPLQSDKEVMEKYSTNPPNVYGFGHKEYYLDVIDCIKNNKKALVDGLEGRKSLELIIAIYESIETGKEVFLRFQPQWCKLGHSK